MMAYAEPVGEVGRVDVCEDGRRWVFFASLATSYVFALVPSNDKPLNYDFLTRSLYTASPARWVLKTRTVSPETIFSSNICPWQY